jgi:hypothetical protein
MSISQTGRKHTIESKTRMSISQTGKKHTIEHREKNSLSKRGKLTGKQSLM